MSRLKSKHTKMHTTWRNVRLGVTTVSVICMVGVATWAFLKPRDQGSNPLTQLVHTFEPIGVTNILLIGNNARNPSNPLAIGQGGGQADIMMIAHIDPQKHQVVLISIPRDLLFAMPQYSVPIPKIKSLFFLGAQMTPNQAAPMTVAGVEHFTGMPITDWVVTDFQGFSDAIDAVGGVHVWIPGRIYDPLHSGANLYPGWQTLTGSQALAYIRVRQNTASNVATNDFSRDDAQAQVLAALQQKLLNKQNDVSHLGSLIHTWNQDVVTNLSVDDLLKIAQVVKGSTIIHVNLASVGDSMDVMSASFPGINQQDALTGAFYDIVDARVVTRTLQPYGSKGAWTGIALPTPSSIPVIVYASEAYVSELKASGYPVTDGNQVSGRNPVVIDYPPGHLAWGLQVGRTLATGNSIVQPGTSSQAVVVYGP